MKVTVGVLLVVSVAIGCLIKPPNINIIKPLANTCYNSTIVIGGPISYYSNDAYYTTGSEIANGWRLFVEWVNYEVGGISIGGNSFMVELAYIEDYSTAQYVENGTRYLLDEYGVEFMFGPFSTSLTSVCSEVTEAANMTLISAGSSVSAVFEGTKHVFGLLPAATKYTQGAFETFSQLGARSISVIADIAFPLCNSTVSADFADVYNMSFHGFYEINSSDPSSLATLSGILSDLKANEVEALFGCSYTSLCAEIIKESKAVDYNPDGIIFAVCATTSALYDAVGEDSAYVLGLTPWAPTSKIVGEYTGWTAQEFSDRYETTFGTVPLYHAAGAFAGGVILKAALEAAQTRDKTVVEGVMRNGNFATIYGNISFIENGQSVNDLLVTQAQPVSLATPLVYPAMFADEQIVYPVPTWNERECVVNTNNCSGHGQCTDEGVCECSYGYYGYEIPDSCDTYCIGTFNPSTGVCIRMTTYYIGHLTAYQFAEAEEYLSHVKLTVELVNNKTDGWFDEETANVILVLNASDSGCATETAYSATTALNSWAMSENSGKTLDGLVGAYCSAGSKAASGFGNSIYLPQVSYSSTAEDLSNKDNFHYFARTCASDSAQGPALAYTLTELGIAPYVAIVHTTEDYARSLADSFSSSYLNIGNNVLLEYAFDSSIATTATYENIVSGLAASGAPAIVLVVYEDQMTAILQAASTHPVLSSTEVVWVGVDAWTDVEETAGIPIGTIGLAPNKPNENITSQYLSLWANLDEADYPDTDGDRSNVAAYALQAVDAVFALAQAYELTLNDNTGLTGDVLKQYVYTVLTRDVEFTGVSGDVDFATSGDLISPVYRICNFQNGSSNEWVSVGRATVDDIDVEYSHVVWPDGSIGVTTSYSEQLIPYCPAGAEPLQTSSGVFSCTPCQVGFYKPHEGRDECMSCPTGADCNDIGVTVPCILKNYWRMEPVDESDIGDFDKYKIYSCDADGICKGGCILNNTCDKHRKQSSPVCGVCVDGYYLSDSQCYKCSQTSRENAQVRAIIYVSLIVGMVLCLVVALSVSLMFNIGSSQGALSSRTSSSDVIKPEPSNQRSPSVFKKAQRSVSDVLFTPALALLTHQDNQRTVKKVIKGSGMTAKITISFLQVITGSFFALDIDWPHYLGGFFSALRINPFRSVQASFSCDDSNSTMDPVFMGIIFCVLAPVLFIIILLCSGGIAWSSYLLTKGRGRPEREKERQWKRLRDICVKIFLWFCLITYPPLSQRILSFFNCRDLGEMGTFLRTDYSVSCESVGYSRTFFVALLGTLLIPIGVPVLFLFVVRNRFHPLLRNPSLLLHDNFAEEWRYYEAYDLIRKLMLTSLVVYVASPDTSSQCLYLLLVDFTALIILAYSRPYANSNDDFLSSALVSVECVAFVVALVVVSGISEEDNYHISSLYTSLFILMLFSLVCFVPVTCALKFKYVSGKVNACLEALSMKGRELGLYLPDLTRLDSRRRMQHEVDDMRNTMHDIRMSLMHPGDLGGIYPEEDDIGSSTHSTDKQTVTPNQQLPIPSVVSPIHSDMTPKDMMSKRSVRLSGRVKASSRSDTPTDTIMMVPLKQKRVETDLEKTDTRGSSIPSSQASTVPSYPPPPVPILPPSVPTSPPPSSSSPNRSEIIVIDSNDDSDVHEI